ncbi:type II secretion system minor pseudopilin GspK [Psychrobacter sp. FBL11]|uniref:Type II secretion system minor pseudopilin GspK n=1 Tax=Psychrobacter saeujeotis TaxID=3143436 RepID=A0ABU9X7P1_9GAMM|nr:type II secretion system minor pseudopilin GspK [uncultured Psychrobacter sp.]
MTMTADSQRGMALLTILLLVVSITVVAGAMLASQKIVIRRSGLLFNQDQLLQDLEAGKQLAITIIRADDKLNDNDSVQDIWAQPLPPYTLGSHSITIELRDEASRFNINNLYHDNAVDSDALEVFERLLTQLNLEPEIAIAVLDWQDPDNEIYNDGGDESVLYGQQTNIRANKLLPNQSLVSIDQLQEVRGVSADTLAILRPYITAVPYFVPININTASPVLLAALMEETTPQQMQTFTDLRTQQALASVDDLWQLPPFISMGAEERQGFESLLAVDSQAFRALITATGNSNVGAAPQRFATVLISKTKSGNDDDMNNNGANNNDASNTSGNNREAKIVTIIAQRLWAFRPIF